MLYLRKIEMSAWDGKPADDSDSISDLATKNHGLSVWEVKDNLEDIDDMALAFALTRDKVEGLTFVLIDPNRLKNEFQCEFSLEEQLGDSGYFKKRGSHKNIILVNVAEMQLLASYIHTLIKEQNKDYVSYFNEMRLLDILKSKIGNEIQLDDLKLAKKGSWRKEVLKLMN